MSFKSSVPILNFMKTYISLTFVLFSVTLMGQDQAQVGSPKINFQVEKSRIIPVPGEGRNLIIQQVKPPLLPTPAEALPRPVVDPVLAEQRRAYWRSIAPLETKLLSLNAIIYDNGLSFLSWGQMNPKGEWEQFEAWSGTDFSSLWVAPDFDIGRTRYYMFASVMKAAAKFSGRRPLPGPLVFDKKSPGYILVKGDPKNAKALAPITALHERYKTEGAQYALDWAALQERSAAEAAWLKANPPPPHDTVIRMWPKQSRRHAAESNSQAQPSTTTTR
jgi:hypothetical protein